MLRVVSVQLDPLWIAQDHRTKNVNRFLNNVRKHGLKLKQDAKVTYSPSVSGQMQYVPKFSVHFGRSRRGSEGHSIL